MRGLVCALAIGGLLTLSGCGSDSPDASPSAPTSTSTSKFSTEPLTPTAPSAGPRPTQASLSAAFASSKNPDTGKRYTLGQASCIARALLATTLSDGALNAISVNIGTYVPSAADDKVFKVALPKILACTA